MSDNLLITTVLNKLKYLRYYLLLTIVFILGIYAQSNNLIADFNNSFEDWIYLLQENIFIIFVTGILAIVVGVGFGILMTRPKLVKFSEFIFQGFNIMAAIPTLAVLAITMTFIGIGFKAAFLGLVIVTILPIVRNTYQGILEVPDYLIEAAYGQGMTDNQILFQVQIPNALFVIIAGIRTGFALNVGTSPLITLIAADSLGEFIFTGIDLNDFNSLLIGSISVGIMAIIVDFIWLQVQYWIIPKGVNPLRN